MFKIRLSVFLGLLLLLQVSLNAHYVDPAEGFYASIFGGPSFPIRLGYTKFDPGYDIGGNVGYKFISDGWNKFRVDISGEHFTGKFKESKIKFGINTLFINGYWDMIEAAEGWFGWYVGAGFGVAIANSGKVGDITISANDLFGKTTTHAVQLITGINYHFSRNFTGFLSYRCLATGHKVLNPKGGYKTVYVPPPSYYGQGNTPTFAGPSTTKEVEIPKQRNYYAHIITLGLTYRFG